MKESKRIFPKKGPIGEIEYDTGIKGFVGLPEVKKEIVAKIYYYRSYYPL